MNPHIIYGQDPETGDDTTTPIAYVAPADPAAAQKVLDATTEGNDGRSEWVWVRLQDGTLILGTFPRGDTYLEASDGDALFLEERCRKAEGGKAEREGLS